MLSLSLPLRTAQLIFTIIVLGLNGYATQWYVDHTTLFMAPRATVLPLFVGAFSLLVLPYLFFNVPLHITHAKCTSNPRFFSKWIVLSLDSALFILWFAACIYESVFRATLILCYGHVCDLMAWGAGLNALLALSFSANAVLAALHLVRTRGKVVMQEGKTHNTWVCMEQKCQS